jgi:hypothetical protein
VKYIQRWDGKPFTVKSQQLTRWACCDCGLVHDIVFATEKAGEPIGVAARVNKRATAARRRAALNKPRASND